MTPDEIRERAFLRHQRLSEQAQTLISRAEELADLADEDPTHLAELDATINGAWAAAAEADQEVDYLRYLSNQ